MTRKQAILKAVEILKQDSSNEEICDILTHLSEELPLVHWSKETILDTFDQFLLENDRLPYVKELGVKSKLPTHTTIRNVFDMTTVELYNQYYHEHIKRCNSSVYHRQSTKYWLEDFKKQYKKLNFPTEAEYNKYRQPNTPCTQHLCKIAGVSGGIKDLLILCGFKPKYFKTDSRYVSNITASVTRCENIDEKALNAISEQLESILNKYD